MDNSNKVILDLCGGTGVWSKPYKDAGYNVELITLPTYDVRRVELREHAIYFERMDVHYHETNCVPTEDIHGILAAPPCTEFSLAKGGQPRDFEAAMGIVEACFRIIWHCRLHGKPKFWAMENPVGFLRQFIGIPQFSFYQWQFGDEGIKPTDVWGYFSSPKPTVRERPADLSVKYPTGTTNGRTMAAPKCPPEYAHLNLNRAALRAITPPGFAQAFYKANK